MAHENDLLTSAQAGLIVRRGRATINLWARRGKVAAAVTMPDGRRLFRREDIERIAAEQDARLGLPEAHAS